MAINNTQRKLLAAVKAIGERNEVADVQRIADEIEFADTASIMVWLGRLTHDDFLRVVEASNAYVITEGGLGALAEVS